MDELSVIIVAAGSSSRFGKKDKQLFLLKGLPLFLHSVRSFLPVAGRIVIAVPHGRTAEFCRIAAEYGYASDKMHFIEGGATRTESVHRALNEVQKHQQGGIVAIHDAARPLATAEMLLELAALAEEYGGAASGHKVTDTLLASDENNVMAGCVPRDGLWCISTPQVFQLEPLLAAYAEAAGRTFTDDTQLFFNSGHTVKIVEERAPNSKLTYASDLKWIEFLLKDSK